MAVVTLNVPSADEQQKMVYNQQVRASNQVAAPLGKKLACVLLQLNDAVMPANYAAIGAAIDAIQGIDKVDLLIDTFGLPDGKTPVVIPAGTQLRLCVDVQLRIDNIPQVL